MPLDKPMSMEGLKEIVLNEMGHPRKEWERIVDHLIAAVRAEERAKCAHEKTEALVSLQQCNNRAAEFVRGQERERVLAEFRMLAEKYSTINYAPIRDSTEHKNTVTAGMKIVQGELSALIQSLENPNQKP